MNQIKKVNHREIDRLHKIFQNIIDFSPTINTIGLTDLKNR